MIENTPGFVTKSDCFKHKLMEKIKGDMIVIILRETNYTVEFSFNLTGGQRKWVAG